MRAFTTNKFESLVSGFFQQGKIERIASIAALSLSVYLLLLHAGLGRPIWYDEFLHFAVAAENNSDEAWALVRRSLFEINHNQTGIYIMIDYWLETAGGASALLLRLPSVFCGALFFLFVIRFFRTLGYSSFWTITGLIALLAQDSAMYFIGEARPYFPLAAAALGTLVYYLNPPQQRHGATEFLGWLAIIVGCLFHPYFIAYWTVLILVTFIHLHLTKSVCFTANGFFRHVNVQLCAVGGLIYFGLALLTWLHVNRTFHFDPFQYLKPSIWASFVDNMHFEFMYPHITSLVITTFLLSIALLFVCNQLQNDLFGIIGPYVLIFAMIFLSLCVGIASYLKSYWIIPRQWIASAAIMPLAFVWLWAELSRVYSKLLPGASVVFWIAATLFMLNDARGAHQELLESLVKYAEAPRTEFPRCGPMPDPPHDKDSQAEAQMWVALANRNIKCGGPVWSVFKAFYADAAPRNLP